MEKRAGTDSAYRAKVAEVHLVEQAMMAAMADLDPFQCYLHFVF